MIDLTTIQAFEILPELSVLNANNIVLKKSNEGYKLLLSTLAIIVIGTGLYLLIKKHQDEREGEI